MTNETADPHVSGGVEVTQADVKSAEQWKGIWGSFANRLPVGDLAYALARHRLSTATPVPATAEGVRDHVAGLIALAGLGTNTGEPRRPHGEWKPQEFTDRIMDIIPTRVVDQCFALADSILAALTTRPTDTAARDEGMVLVPREALEPFRRWAHWAVEPHLAAHSDRKLREVPGMLRDADDEWALSQNLSPDEPRLRLKHFRAILSALTAPETTHDR